MRGRGRVAWAGSVAGRYGGRSTAAALDLGLYSAGNLILNVLLARSVGPDRYGLFTTVFVTYLFFAALHEAVFTEPMVVFGAKERALDRAAYLRSVLTAHLSVMVPLATTVAVAVALLTQGGPAGSTMVAAALVAPVLTAGQMMSRAAYLGERRWLPAYSSAAYLGGVVGIATVLDLLGALTPAAALAALAGGAIIGAAPVVSSLGILRAPGAAIGPTARRHWTYGRWSVAASAIRWIPGNLPILAVSAWAGYSAASRIRAAALFTTPALLAISVLGVLALPAFARDGSADRITRRARLLAVGLSTAGLVFVGVAVLIGPQTMAAVLGERFRPSLTLVVLMAAIPSVTCVSAIYGAVLRSIEKPSSIFGAGVVSLVGTVTVGLPLVRWFGASGAAGALLISNLGLATATALAARRALRERCQPTPDPR